MITTHAELLKAEFVARAPSGRFFFSRCVGCADWTWPPIPSCPCRHGLEWVEVGGVGTVSALCEVFRGIGRPFDEETPYTIVVVELDEGFSFITRAMGDLQRGERARLKWAAVQGEPWPCAVSGGSGAHG